LTASTPKSPRLRLNKVNNTADVGTYLYSSPENKTSSYSTKVDMYSLGIILFELWHPFDTFMERCVLIENLRSKCALPKGFVDKYPEQTEYIMQLVDHNPSRRPSADEFLNTLNAKHKESGSTARRLRQDTSSLHQKVEELTTENCQLKRELTATKDTMAAMQAQLEQLQRQLASLGSGKQ